MRFTKMQGAGNDFIIINNIEEKLPEDSFPHLARRLCARRLSVGADGLLVVDHPLEGGDFRLIFYNCDGLKGEMCGNGARCICRYGYENGLSGDTQLVETTAGLVTGRRISAREYTVRLNDPSVIKLSVKLTCGGTEYDCSYVELGNPGIPHAVVRVDDVDAFSDDDLRHIGSLIRHNEAFPKGANVNFCTITGENTVRIRTFERGVEDLTLACGTGAGSSVCVLTLLGSLSGKDVKINADGGVLTISLERDGMSVKNILLTGPTNTVAEGEIKDEEL